MITYKKYPEYKDSGVEWLGDIPIDWKISSFATLFNRTKELGDGTGELLSVYREHGVIPKTSRNDNHNVASEDLSKYQIVKKGNLVVNKMKAWQGSMAISAYNGIVSPAYFVYTPRYSTDDVESRFIHYLLRSAVYVPLYKTISKGIRLGQWDLDQKYFHKTPILLPSLETQQKIVEFLDKEASHIDAGIANMESLIALLTEKRSALISETVTRGIPSEHTEFKDSGVDWLGEIPAGWQKISFGQVFRRIKNMGTGDEELLSVYREYGVIPKSSRNDNHNVASEDLSKYQIVQKNDLVINKMKAWQGSLAISDYGGIVSPAYFVFKPVKKYNASLRFLHFLMRSDRYKGFYASISKGIRLGQWDLDQKSHKSMPLVIPKLDEQRRIVNFIESEILKIDNLKSEAQKAIDLLKEKRQVLISDVVTGKIDVSGGVN